LKWCLRDLQINLRYHSYSKDNRFLDEKRPHFILFFNTSMSASLCVNPVWVVDLDLFYLYLARELGSERWKSVWNKDSESKNQISGLGAEHNAA
jgi:hypothetical protein